MLRYRGYEWALVHGESLFEVHLGHPGSKHPEPMWWLRMQFIAVGAEWRRCSNLDRPHFFVEISNFDVKPGDWRHLAEVDYWNKEVSGSWLDDSEEPNSGWFRASFYSSYRADHERVDSDFGDANWRVVRMDGPLVTIELSGDTEEGNQIIGTPEMAATAPGAAGAEEPRDTGGHEVYLLETIPFGLVTATVPRNARDPLAYAELLARRQLKTPAADHLRLRDHKDHHNEAIRGDLYVDLHLFGYQGT